MPTRHYESDIARDLTLAEPPVIGIHGPQPDMRCSPSGGGDIAGIQIGPYRVVPVWAPKGWAKSIALAIPGSIATWGSESGPHGYAAIASVAAASYEKHGFWRRWIIPTSPTSTIWRTWGMSERRSSSRSRAPVAERLAQVPLSVREALAVARQSRTRSGRLIASRWCIAT